MTWYWNPAKYARGWGNDRGTALTKNKADSFYGTRPLRLFQTGGTADTFASILGYYNVTQNPWMRGTSIGTGGFKFETVIGLHNASSDTIGFFGMKATTDGINFSNSSDIFSGSKNSFWII